jgi:ABC-type antimicrobial peptide transport system permease subunit
MLYNIKMAYRNLRRNGLYSVINMSGLAISLAACILIMLWVWDEVSFDRFHKNADCIYRININMDKSTWPVMPLPLGEAIMENLPSVENCCRISGANVVFLEYEGQKFYDHKIAEVDTSFFNLFSFKLLKGNVQNLTPDGMVISQTVAKKIFGDRDPMEEMVKTSSGNLYRVAAIMEDMPSNSTIEYDVLLFPDRKNNEKWGNFMFATYLQLNSGSDTSSVGEDIATLFRSKYPIVAEMSFTITLQNIKQHHLYTPDGKAGGMQTVKLFSLIGVLILVIAGINYVNLITARATKRRKEIGLRKVVGASKINLLGQLLGEAVLLFLMSIVLAWGIVAFVIPYYNSLTTKTFDLVSYSSQIIRICAGAFIAVVLLAGLYPAFMISSFEPVEAFRNKSGRGATTYFRKALVIIQFVFSAGLIMGTFVIGRQLHYIQSLNPGYDHENVAIIPIHKMDLSLVRGELLDLQGIAGITASDFEICQLWNSADADWEGKDPNEIFLTSNMLVESNFISTMGLKLISGSDFTGTEADKDGFIVNETAARMMGFDDPIGKHIKIFGWMEGAIIGVVNDFHHANMHNKIKPVVLYRNPQRNYNLLYARIEPGKIRMALDNIEKVWKRYNDDYQFTYNFVDESFDKMHRADLNIGMLFNIFAFIAIMISCLGLFGLITFTAESKTKEIGIRKVLGASVSSIVMMLSQEFLILIGIAMLIAFPLAFFLLNGMLEDFAYRIDISWWMFAVSALVVVVLTLLTVGFQAIKAATADPVKAIKTE